MKKRIILLFFIIPLVTGCVRQKECENPCEGIIVVCKKPYVKGQSGNKIYAHFYPDIYDVNDIVEVDEGYVISPYFSVINKLPNEFKGGDKLHVFVSYEKKDFYSFQIHVGCIEKVNP